MFKVLNHIKEDKWIELLNELGEATIYHSPEWKRFLENTFDYEPHYIFAEDENGRLSGILPLFKTNSRLTGNKICSVPFSHICGPIGDKNAKEELINIALDYYGKSDAKWLEVREMLDFSGFENQNLYSTYILKLSTDISSIWKKIDKGSVRWAIRKSEKLGVSVESVNAIEDIRILYELNCLTKKDLGVPCHPWRFFRNLFTFLNKNISLYNAVKDHEVIASGVMVHFKDTLIYAYGAANPSALDAHPYHAFIWTSIQEACKKGYTYYDFGRCSYDNIGLINFKKRWGTVEKKLYYSKFPKYGRSISDSRNGITYSIAQKAIHSMPLPLYKKFSDQVFGSFG